MTAALPPLEVRRFHSRLLRRDLYFWARPLREAGAGGLSTAVYWHHGYWNEAKYRERQVQGDGAADFLCAALAAGLDAREAAGGLLFVSIPGNPHTVSEKSCADYERCLAEELAPLAEATFAGLDVRRVVAGFSDGGYFAIQAARQMEGVHSLLAYAPAKHPGLSTFDGRGSWIGRGGLHLCVGKEDGFAFHISMLHRRLTHAGVPHVYREVPGAGHRFEDLRDIVAVDLMRAAGLSDYYCTGVEIFGG